jgi:hypothetical protein
MGLAAYLRFTDGMGSFTVSVLDPLKGPATAPALIPFMVEVCAGKDFSLSKFAGPLFAPHEYPTPTLQSGKVITFEKDMTQFTAGEAWSSVKQIITMPHHTFFDFGQAISIAVMPWFYNRTYPNTVPGPIGSAMRNVSFTPGGTAATAYLFVKGGTDAHIYSAGGGSQDVLYRAVQFPGTGGYSAAPTGSIWTTNRPNSAIPAVMETGEGAHFRFPLYPLVRRVSAYLLNNLVWNTATVVQTQAPAASLPFSISDISVVSSLGKVTPTAKFTGFLARAAADDAALAHYMGPVPFVLPSTDVGNIYDPDSQVYYTPPVALAAQADIAESIVDVESTLLD